MSEQTKLRATFGLRPGRLCELKAGDHIEGPYGRYHLRVTAVDEHCVEGIYTKCPQHGYPVGSECRYLRNDWNSLCGSVWHIDPTKVGAQP